MKLELDSAHGKIIVDDSDIVMESEHYDIYEGVKAMRGGIPDKTVRCFAIHNEYGCVAVVFARNEQDAMDDAADAGKLGRALIAEADRCRIMYAGAGESEDTYEDETITYLGNAGEPYLLDNIGLMEIPIPSFSLSGLFFASTVNAAHEHATVTYYRSTGGMNIDISPQSCQEQTMAEQFALPSHFYEVIVSNVGNVHNGSDDSEARKVYEEYCRLVDDPGNGGRAKGESVALLCDDEVVEEQASAFDRILALQQLFQ